MVSSVYAKPMSDAKCVQLDIFVNNAIEDQSQVSTCATSNKAKI